jgi:hypothetical protein
MMTIHERSNELGAAYLLALDELRAVETALLNTVTVAEEERAATRLRRVAAGVRFCREELLTHCARHGCPLPVPGLEPGGVVRRDSGAAAAWAGGIAA